VVSEKKGGKQEFWRAIHQESPENRKKGRREETALRKEIGGVYLLRKRASVRGGRARVAGRL